MIAANELRLGNWVEILGDYTQIWRIVKDIGKPVINRKTEDIVNPIPLTPEILEKCGFELVNDNGGGDKYWHNGMLDLTIDMKLSTSTREYDSQTVDGCITITTLHQLQNLYFALTGEELNYKP